MELTDMRRNIIDMTWAISLIRQATFGYFKIDMEIAKIMTGDIAFS